MKKIKNNSLYLVTGEEYGNGKGTLEIAKEAILGGIDILQMREKKKSREELMVLGRQLSKLCAKNNVIFIVNDDPYLVKDVGADGVHLGQEDIETYSIEKTRDIIGSEKMIGISTHSIDQFRSATQMDVNYIAFGPIFHTKTKNYTIGTEDIGHVMAIANKPVIFIGGINADSVDEVLGKGAKNIAVIRAIIGAEEIIPAANELKRKLMKGNPETIATLSLTVNGKEEKLAEGKDLADLIKEKGLNPDRIVIEHNADIIEKKQWSGITLNEGDNIEIITFMGGGAEWKTCLNLAAVKLRAVFL